MIDKTIVLSGIRATGRMHLGNYYGALRHQVALANDPKNYCLFFVADLHTLTTATDPEALRRMSDYRLGGEAEKGQ